MPRPFKCRRISAAPEVDYFKPRGIPLAELEEVVLTLDEFEAIRLADLDGLYQEEAAGHMNVSRQTFGNIVESAHRKIAQALVNGKALRINGGICEMPIKRKFQCSDCSHVFEVPFGIGRPMACPQCGKNNIHREDGGMGGGRGRGGYGRGRCFRGGRS
jgi:predicted DNA-binding protein (UPF0251 family)